VVAHLVWRDGRLNWFMMWQRGVGGWCWNPGGCCPWGCSGSLTLVMG
jgi:hypothetical protein